LFKRPRDNLNICPDAARPAELPQLLGGPVVLMNRLVYGVGVDLTSAIPIQLFGDMLDEIGQSRLVVGSYEGARSLSLCLAAHDGHVTLANASRIGA
jgi:hypothetical protein